MGKRRNQTEKGWSKSGYRGVYPYRDGRWQVLLSIDGEMRYLGLFEHKNEAVQAVQKALGLGSGVDPVPEPVQSAQELPRLSTNDDVLVVQEDFETDWV